MNPAPLGPVREKPAIVAGKDATYYLDQMGNEYTSVSHVLRCAIVKALKL